MIPLTMRSHVRRARLAVLPLAALSTLPALAQSPSSTFATQTLPATVVTATRVETRASELTSEVLVIDRRAIERSGGQTLVEVLARTASAQISANGGRGTTSSVFIRGAESRHTLLLIDGVRYGSATAGGPVWDNIPLEMIERIEVLKGPASSVYGADAAGGVVQVFTRRGKEGFFPHASVGVGSKSFREVAAGFQGGAGDVSYALSVQDLDDKGFSATNPQVPWGMYNEDRDGFEQRSVSGSLDWRFARGWKLDLNTLHSDGEVQFDDGPGADARSKLRSSVLRAGVEGQLTQGWKSRLGYGRSADRSNGIASASPWGLPALFESTQEQWTWQNDIATPLGLVVAGLERLEQSVDSSTPYDVTDRTIDSVFVGLTGGMGAHTWQLSARRDDNSQFGDYTTGSAGYGYQITPAWRVHGAYGTSFVAPTFNQLYWPGYGSPDLLPEKGKNAELGVTWAITDHQIKLIRFDNRIRGYITPGAAPVNVPRALIDGWTLGYEGRIGDLALSASFDALDPRNEQTGLQLQRRAKRQLNLGADYSLGAWTLGGRVLHVGKRFEDAANTQALKAYTTLDLSAGYAVSRDWKLQLSLVNVTDKQYETALGYNQPGRGAFLTLRWQGK